MKTLYKGTALARIAKALKESKKIQAEVKDDGAWYEEFTVGGYLPLGINYDLDGVMTIGFYDNWNGDTVCDPEFRFASTRNGIKPIQFRSDVTGRVYYLDKENTKSIHLDSFGVVDVGRKAAEVYGVYSILQDFDNTVARKFEKLIDQKVRG